MYELMGYSLKHDTPENRAIAEEGFNATFGKNGAAHIKEWVKVPFEQVIEEQQTYLENRMEQAFAALNALGQTVACERVEELAKIKDYTRPDAAQDMDNVISPRGSKKPPEDAAAPPDGKEKPDES